MIKVTESDTSVSLVYISRTGNTIRLRRFYEGDSEKMRRMLKEIGAVERMKGSRQSWQR